MRRPLQRVPGDLPALDPALDDAVADGRQGQLHDHVGRAGQGRAERVEVVAHVRIGQVDVAGARATVIPAT